MFHVDSEVGRLRQVILHRPGLELMRLTPDNAAELLFDDMLWVAEAQAEHDAFAAALSAKAGVPVAAVYDDTEDAGVAEMKTAHIGVVSLPFFLAHPLGMLLGLAFKLYPFGGPPLTADQVDVASA